MRTVVRVQTFVASVSPSDTTPPTPTTAIYSPSSSTMLVQFDRALMPGSTFRGNWVWQVNPSQQRKAGTAGTVLPIGVTIGLPALITQIGTPTGLRYLAAPADVFGANGVAVQPFDGLAVQIII